MKCCDSRLGLARRLLAFSVSFAVVLSSHVFALAAPGKSLPKAVAQTTQQPESAKRELQIGSASATATKAGVLLHWSTNSTPDNLGFNVYRVKDGQRTRINKEIIPGALFAGSPAMVPGYSYAWFDRDGSADDTYVIESVSIDGAAKSYQAITPVASKTFPAYEQAPAKLDSDNANAVASTDLFVKQYPAEEAYQPNVANGTRQQQWAIAGQTALKIGIKKDGWYRVTQPQMVAAGFNPTVDIRNLQLFGDADEVAIDTSQSSGEFGSGDYIEFYGRGLDVPTSDTRIYYLVAGTTPGKRVAGEIHLDGDPVLPPIPTPKPVSPAPASGTGPVLRDPIFYSWIQNDVSSLLSSVEPNNPPAKPPLAQPEVTSATSAPVSPVPDQPAVEYALTVTEPQPATARVQNPSKSLALANAALAIVGRAPRGATRQEPVAPRTSASKKRKGGRLRRRTLRRERSHADVNSGFTPTSFDSTAERKDRNVYFSNLLNGDAENYFGQVVSFNVASQTLTAPNPDLTAIGPAKLEVAMQGVNFVYHEVNLKFNGVSLGLVLPPQNVFFGQSNIVATFDVPVSLLQDVNTLTFTPPGPCVPSAPCPDTTIVDYTRLTYPHQFRADSGSLRFSLRGTQSVTVDGFTTSSVRLIDYTDPLAVRISRPSSQSSASGFAITVPVSSPPSKTPRLFYAITDGQFDQPASISLNQPSNLNQGILSQTINSGADFLIVSHKDFIGSFAPLLSQRQSQGLTAAAVDVEDVYDEFSYGVHGPQAIKDFLAYAAAHWVTKPRYIIFAGDASLDPRNYQGLGNFDLVPTKLIDTSYEETADDDWLADFNDDDGIADIPVGRIPVRTAAEADWIVSKIVNYAPANVPQVAFLIADDPVGGFDFEDGNNNVQALLPASTTVQKSYRRLEVKVLTGTISANSGSSTVTGTGTLFTTPTEVQVGSAIAKDTGEPLGTVASISSATTLTLTANAPSTYTGAYGKQDDATAHAHIIAGINQGPAIVNYSGHGNIDVWTGVSLFTTADATALGNGMQKLPFVIVMDCLNGYFQDPRVLSLSEAFLKAPGGGAVAAFASSGKTTTPGQRQMELELYHQLYGSQPMALGDAIKIAKGATFDIDVKRTWIFFGDPSLKIR